MLFKLFAYCGGASIVGYQAVSLFMQRSSSNLALGEIMEFSKYEEPLGIRLLLVGDVMLGRGVDQILPHQVSPLLHEDYVKNAKEYVTLAEDVNGPLPKERGYDYVWGNALQILNDLRPNVRIINLETSVTTNDVPWPSKGIHYRMHPKNVEVLKVAKIDCAVLSNNHVLDWHYAGLEETLSTLRSANISCPGAGSNLAEASTPAIFKLKETKCRVIVFAYGHSSSGVPDAWQARWLSVQPNSAQIDLIHGHSSHHIKGVEVYKGKLIIYGAGDFLSDYEGIKGIGQHYGFRDDVSFMYFPDIDPSNGTLTQLLLVPMRLKHIQVNLATNPKDLTWLFDNMKRECRRLKTNIEKDESGQFFKLVWSKC